MTEALAQVRRLAQEHGNDLAFVVNHSRGKDSQDEWVWSGRCSRTSRLIPSWRTTGFEHHLPVSAAD